MKKEPKQLLENRAIGACYRLLEYLEGGRRQSTVLIGHLRGVVRAHKQSLNRNAQGQGRREK